MKERYDGIQALRGLAALLVLLAHVEFLAPGPSFWSARGAGMGAGVDVFFVISGFVVAMSLERTPNAGSFFWNRLTRVLPLYLFVSAPLLLIEPMDFGKYWNTFLLWPAFDFGAYSTPAHWFGWSIGLEIWYYTVLGAAFFLSRRNAVRLFCATTLIGVLSLSQYEGDWMLPRFLGAPLALEFMLGVVLFRFRGRLTRPVWMVGAGGALLAVFAFSFPQLGDSQAIFANYSMGVQRMLLWGIPAALLVGGVAALDQSGAAWSPKAVWFGDISYSFYLLQPLVILALRPVLASLPPMRWSLAWLLLIALNLAVAAALNRRLEAPMTRWLRRATLRRDGTRPPRPLDLRADAHPG